MRGERHAARVSRLRAPSVAEAGELSVVRSTASVWSTASAASAAPAPSAATSTPATSAAASTSSAASSAGASKSTIASRADGESAIDRAGAEASQTKTVVAGEAAHTGGNAQTVYTGAATIVKAAAGAARAATTTTGLSLTPAFIIACRRKATAGAAVHQERFVITRIYRRCGIQCFSYRRGLTIGGGCGSAYRGALKASIRSTTRPTLSRTAPPAAASKLWSIVSGRGSRWNRLYNSGSTWPFSGSRHFERPFFVQRFALRSDMSVRWGELEHFDNDVPDSGCQLH